MQILCKSSEASAETFCSVCGQGFVLYWERQTRMQPDEALVEVQNALRTHHRRHDGSEVHPAHGFLVPDWDGPIAFSGAALLGNAPSWAL